VRRSVIALAAGLALGVLGAPAAALANRHIVQPGDPGSTQYQEDVPTAQGSRPVTTIHTGPAATAVATIPAPTAHSLTAHGATGRAALSLAEQTAPVISSPEGGSSTGPSDTSLSYHPTAAVGVLAGALLGERGGMGVFLPIILGLALGSAITVAAIRRRS
jgi:hypothetical protein